MSACWGDDCFIAAQQINNKQIPAQETNTEACFVVRSVVLNIYCWLATPVGLCSYFNGSTRTSDTFVFVYPLVNWWNLSGWKDVPGGSSSAVLVLDAGFVDMTWKIDTTELTEVLSVWRFKTVSDVLKLDLRFSWSYDLRSDSNIASSLFLKYQNT